MRARTVRMHSLLVELSNAMFEKNTCLENGEIIFFQSTQKLFGNLILRVE